MFLDGTAMFQSYFFAFFFYFSTFALQNSRFLRFSVFSCKITTKGFQMKKKKKKKKQEIFFVLHRQHNYILVKSNLLLEEKNLEDRKANVQIM